MREVSYGWLIASLYGTTRTANAWSPLSVVGIWPTKRQASSALPASVSRTMWPRAISCPPAVGPWYSSTATSDGASVPSATVASTATACPTATSPGDGVVMDRTATPGHPAPTLSFPPVTPPPPPPPPPPPLPSPPTHGPS